MEDEKNVEQTSTEEASTHEESEEVGTNESVSESEEESVEPTESEEATGDGEIDFEAELEAERKRIEQRLGKKVDRERAKRLDAERNSLSREDVERIANEAAANALKSVQKGQIEAEADRLSGGNQSLKELILIHHQNSIIPSGNVREDMENAFAIANKKRVSGQLSELKKTTQSRKNLTGASDAGAPITGKKQSRYSQDEIDGAKFAEVSVEEFVKGRKE